jgi:hypothetical protein
MHSKLSILTTVTYQVFWQEKPFQQFFLEAFQLPHRVFPIVHN